jgi:hypothetical protein
VSLVSSSSDGSGIKDLYDLCRCVSTEDRQLLPKVSDFDAVVFHMLAMQNSEDLPKERSPHQG